MWSAPKILELLFHLSVILWLPFPNYGVVIYPLTVVFAVVYLFFKQKETLELYEFRGCSKGDIIKTIVASVGVHFAQGKEGWTLYLIYYLGLQPHNTASFALALVLNFLLGVSVVHSQWIDDNRVDLRKSILLIAQIAGCLYSWDFSLVSISSPFYYIVAMEYFPIIFGVFCAVPFDATGENGKTILTKIPNQEVQIEWLLGLEFLFNVALLFNACSPYFNLNVWIWRVVITVAVCQKGAESWKQLPTDHTLTKKVTFPLFASILYTFSSLIGHCYSFFIVSSPHPSAAFILTKLVCQLFMSEKLSGWLLNKNYYWRYRMLFLFVETLRMILSVETNPQTYIILFTYCVVSEICSQCVRTQWIRDYIAVLINKFITDLQAYGVSPHYFSVEWFMMWTTRLLTWTSIIYCFYPSWVLRACFILISLFCFLLNVGSVVDELVRERRSSKLARNAIICNGVARILLAFYQQQDDWYFAFFTPNVGFLAFYYVCYVTFNFVIGQVVLTKYLGFDLFPVSSSSLLRQADLFLFQFCTVIYQQKGLGTLLFWHLLLLFIYVSMIWLFQVAWLLWMKVLVSVKVNPTTNQIDAILQPGAQSDSDAQAVSVKTVNVQKTGKEFLADVSHLVAFIGTEYCYDMVQDANGHMTIRKRNKSFKCSWSNSLYIPFYRYGILGLTTLSDSTIAEIQEEKEKEYRETERPLNVFIRSCQEFALEFSTDVLNHKDNLLYLDREMFQPVSIVNEKKTNIKTLALLVAYYLMPLALFCYFNISVLISYNSGVVEGGSQGSTAPPGPVYKD